MSRLQELEAAAVQLPAEDRQQLLIFIAMSLRRDRERIADPHRFPAAEVASWLAEDQAEMQRFQAGA
jgi:hypothetical protein